MSDPLWENEIYAAGKFPRAPYEIVASFVYRNAPPRPAKEVRILEIGCGPGNNLWFLASEGYTVAGTDGSKRAIEYARQRLSKGGLLAQLRVEDFPRISFADASFDLVVERAALCCVSLDEAAETIREVRRVLVPGGRFFFNPYSGKSAPNPGESVATGIVCFYDRKMIDQAFGPGWKFLRIHQAELRDDLDRQRLITGDWRVEAEKV